MARPSQTPVEASGCGFWSNFREVLILPGNFMSAAYPRPTPSRGGFSRFWNPTSWPLQNGMQDRSGQERMGLSEGNRQRQITPERTPNLWAQTSLGCEGVGNLLAATQ